MVDLGEYSKASKKREFTTTNGELVQTSLLQIQTWHLKKSVFEYGARIEFEPVEVKFKASISFLCYQDVFEPP